MRPLLLPLGPVQRILLAILLPLAIAMGVWMGYLAVESGELLRYFAAFSALVASVAIVRLVGLPYVKVENGELREQWSAVFRRKYRLSDMAEVSMRVSLSSGQSSLVVPVLVMRDGAEARLKSAACKPGSAYHRRVVEFTEKVNEMIRTPAGSETA